MYVILLVFLFVIILLVFNIFCFVILIEFGEKMGMFMVIFLMFVVLLMIINDLFFKLDNIFYFSIFLVI